MMRRPFPLFALLAIALIPRAPVLAQGGGSPVLFEPFDWGGNAAWRRRAAEVRTTRDQLLRQGDLRRLNAVRGGPLARAMVFGSLPSEAVTGAFHVPVIAIAYKNIPVPYPVSEYQCLLFSRTPGQCAFTNPNPGPRPYSVTTFYEQLSRDRITMDGVVLPAVRVDSNSTWYTNNCYGIGISGPPCSDGGRRLGLMLRAILDSISNRPGGDTIWRQFDNDGPDGVPNSGDDDGTVDFVTFLQPEVGGECQSNSPKPTGIWSHRYTISSWGVGAWTSRTPWFNHPGQFLQVNDYTIQSGVGGDTACNGAVIMPVGTVAHETGHAFGLPDLYDTSGQTQGIGGWGLMGSGNYARPYSPASYDAWSLNALGWTTLDTLNASRTITAGPRQLTDTVFYARTDNPDEYVLIENRQAVLSDSAHMDPGLPDTCPMLGFCAKSPGLLLWLINRTKVSTGLLGNSVNATSVQGIQGVELIQADGFNELRTNGSKNRGDRGDAYPGSRNNSRFSLLATPSARDNLGSYIGFTVDQITQLGGGLMRFRFNRRAPSLIRALNSAQIRVNGEAWTRYEEVIPGGDQIQLGADDIQLLASGKTRARFLAWSHGGAREQTFTSSVLKPDSLTASFALEHRLLLVSIGGGSVTSSASGDLSQGVFFADGAPITLTAVAPAGTVFVGWRGDTVATAPVLQLAMRRGYDLEARFITQVSVGTEDAVTDLLGTPRLSDAQRLYLDELGNRNGLYDVGDLLAMYRRLGQAAPAALLRNLEKRRIP